MLEVKAKPGIEQINLYEGGLARIDGQSNVVKLSSNENPLGPSDAAIEAFRRTSFGLHRYPSSDHMSLRQAIGSVFDLDPKRIICGVGSDEVLGMIAHAYAGPEDDVIFTEHGFALYRNWALATGARPVEVREQERFTDVDAILEACSERTKLIFIANPNNPTGTMISGAEITHLADHIPQQALLVLDGAYVDYVEGYDGGAKLAEERHNVFMTRTFSKLYGLGGMRVGWGYGPKNIINNLNRIRGPFNLSAAALAAAEAALLDRAYVKKCLDENNRLRTWLTEALAKHGVPSDTSLTNFILARFSSQEEAEACDDFLKSEGLIVRRVGGYNLPTCLRITVGDERACRRVAHCIGQFKAGQR